MSTSEARVRVPEGVLFRELEGESVLLNQQNGRYYGLNEVGTRMWNSLTKHGRVAPAVHELAGEYDAREERIRRDLLELVNDLAAEELLEIVDGEAG